MTDSQREKDGFDLKKCIFVSNYSTDHPHPAYTADDGSFSELWDWSLDVLLPEEHALRCWRYGAGWEKESMVFDCKQADQPGNGSAAGN